MRRATKTVASWLGIAAGIAGLEHGYYEILQGNAHPASLMFPSMGPSCDPEEVWNRCEPAMSIIPHYLVTGILSVTFGLAILIWSGFFVQRRHGGWVLMLLLAGMLLFGGGIFPPLIGFIAGAAGTRINKPLPDKPSGWLLRLAASLWPWPLVIFMAWVWGQFVVGYFFNDFLISVMGFGLLLILVSMPLAVYTAYARDRVETDR